MAKGGNPHPVHTSKGFQYAPNLNPLQTPDLAPEDWSAFWEGYIQTLGDGEKVTLAHQEAFLADLERAGVITQASRAAGVTHYAIEYWVKTNKLHFNRRYEEAFQSYKHHLRELGMNRLEHPVDRLGSDVLLIAYNNAFNSEYFKRDGPAQADSGIKELLGIFKELAQHRRGQTIEGTSTEVDKLKGLLGPGVKGDATE